MTLTKRAPPVREESRRGGETRFDNLNFPNNISNHNRAQTGPCVILRPGA